MFYDQGVEKKRRGWGSSQPSTSSSNGTSPTRQFLLKFFLLPHKSTMDWRPSLFHISFRWHLPNYSRVGHNSYGISWDEKYISCTTTCTWEYIVEWSWGGKEYFPCYWPGRTGMYWLFYCHHTLHIHSLSFLRNVTQTTASQVSLDILHLVVVDQ